MGSAAPAIGLIGSSLISSLGAPDGQGLQSFSDAADSNLDPNAMYGEMRSQLNDMISPLKQRANTPVTLRSSYAQNLPVFTGGGLPMPIGIYGTDPALRDPSLLSSTPSMLLSGARVNNTPSDRTHPPAGSSEAPPSSVIPNPSDPNSPAPDPNAPPTSHGYNMPQRRGVSLIRGNGQVPQQADDLAQGAGAVELLLRSGMF